MTDRQQALNLRRARRTAMTGMRESFARPPLLTPLTAPGGDDAEALALRQRQLELVKLTRR